MATPERADRILTELASRYELAPEFLNKVRPMVDRIFSDEISEEDRTPLLEMLAETCERDLQLRRGSESLREALAQLIATLHDLRNRVRELGGDSGPGGPKTDD